MRIAVFAIACVALLMALTLGASSEDDIIPENAEMEHIEADGSVELQLAQEVSAESVEGRRRRRKGGFFKKATKHVSKHVSNAAKKAADAAKKAADAAKKAAQSAYNGFMKTANAGVNSMDRAINKMSSPPNYMAKLVNVAKKGSLLTMDITKAIFGVVGSEERASFIQELAQMHDKSATKGRACFSKKIPNIAKTGFNIKNIKSPVSIPNKSIRFCEPSWMQKARQFFSLKRMVTWGKFVMNAWGKAFNWVDNTFDARDQMFLGPRCNEATMGIQFTASLSAGAAKGAGGGITAEVGFQVGCMSGLPKNLQGKQGSRRWVIVPMWGFAGAVSAGYASPGAGIDGNVYLYKPFTYYKSFGHELSIGADVRGNAKPGHGGAADVIFGCCTSPLSKNGAPIDIVTKTKDFGFGLKLKYPVKPFVKIAVTGGHVAVQIASTPLGEQEVRLIQPSTGLEIETQTNSAGEYEPVERVSLLQDDADADKVEVTINVAYARACRKFAGAGDCFKKFNP